MCLVQHKLDQKIFPAENVGHGFKIPLFLKQNPPILYTEQAGKQSENECYSKVSKSIKQTAEKGLNEVPLAPLIIKQLQL